MEREIKFRGFSSNMNKWVYGGIKFIESDAFIIHHQGIQLDFSNAVINKSVGQYTGLKDKNGKEIYERDVLKRIQIYDDGSCPDLHLGVVTWDDCSYYSRSIKNEISRGLGNKADCVSYEVIGNIYENPELL